jgi:hypothetical protein
MRSWKSGTQKQYTTYLTKWAEYCIKRKLDSTRPTVNNVLNFLHTLYAQDLSYSTRNMACSASSACLLDTTFSDTNYTITNHPLLIRYMKGVFNSWKPTPKYSETCDVNTVLNYLAKLFPLDNLSLKDHSFKLVMLLALISGQRCQTLTHISYHTDYYVYQIYSTHRTEPTGKCILYFSYWQISSGGVMRLSHLEVLFVPTSAIKRWHIN